MTDITRYCRVCGVVLHPRSKGMCCRQHKSQDPYHIEYSKKYFAKIRTEKRANNTYLICKVCGKTLHIKAIYPFCVKHRKLNFAKYHISTGLHCTTCNKELRTGTKSGYCGKCRDKSPAHLKAVKERYEKIAGTPEARQKRTEYARHRRASDLRYTLIGRLRSRVKSALKSKHHKKTTGTVELVGISIDRLIIFLECTFYLIYGRRPLWNQEALHIDHIIPLSFAKTKEHMEALCHYSNLQLLTAEDNLKKSDSLDFVVQDENKA